MLENGRTTNDFTRTFVRLENDSSNHSVFAQLEEKTNWFVAQYIRIHSYCQFAAAQLNYESIKK